MALGLFLAADLFISNDHRPENDVSEPSNVGVSRYLVRKKNDVLGERISCEKGSMDEELDSPLNPCPVAQIRDIHFDTTDKRPV